MRNFADHLDTLADRRPLKLLVLANSRPECERLKSALADLPGIGSSVFAHYSSLSTEYRLKTERRFAELTCGVYVATSTLELGIDIGDIDAVLLWGVPDGVESFLQRIGRGNRRAIRRTPFASFRILLNRLAGTPFGSHLSSMQPAEERFQDACHMSFMEQWHSKCSV